MVNQSHEKHTVERIQKAIREGDYATLNAIVMALDVDQARALVAAMSLALFDV